jgi:colicin import membrane protein
MAEEERVAAAQASGLQDRWVAQIQSRIERAWIRPPSARSGLDCIVQVTQVPGGEVVSAKIRRCNGDEAVRQSIEAAVLRASPLPAPPDPALFVRDIEVRFRPND